MLTGYVLRRHEDSKFVAWPGNESSYTTSIRQARIFATREEAEGHKCENESVHPIESFFRGQQ